MKNDKQLNSVLGKQFKKGRINSSLSQAEASKKLGYSNPQFLSNFERGLCSMPLNKLKILIDLYEMDGEEVVLLINDLQSQFIRSELISKRNRKTGSY